jgi:hypothetical protein
MREQIINQETQAQIANTLGSLAMENINLSVVNRHLVQENTELKEQLTAMEQDK